VHEKRFKGNIDRLRAPERVARLEVDRVVDLCLEGGSVGSVLEVGMGTGLFAEAFSRRAIAVTGIDTNPEMVIASRSYIPDGNFQEGLAEEVPYPDHSFDLVFLGLLLHESDEPLKTLTEAHRVARKRVCILEWPYREQPFGPPLAHRMDPEVLIGLFHKAGFRKWKVIELTNTSFYRLEN
jgi:ubiquinone/menaquinone biosynthesis C-methylase UbiE